MPKRLSLTPDLIARAKLTTLDISPAPIPIDRRQATDADFSEAVNKILATAPSKEFWVFAYGSLIWNPAFDFVETRTSVVRGWRRSFCLGWDKWYRGSAAQPGLMLVLDRGGQCNGVSYRLPSDAIEDNLDRLMRREIRIMPHSFPARWIKVNTHKGPVQAVAFIIDRQAPGYVGGLSVSQTADILAVAVGQWGSMAEYLHSTVAHLEQLGIHDGYLWRLQEMVAERIASRAQPSSMADLPCAS